jgi:hypothetical protein
MEDGNMQVQPGRSVGFMSKSIVRTGSETLD